MDEYEDIDQRIRSIDESLKTIAGGGERRRGSRFVADGAERCSRRCRRTNAHCGRRRSTPGYDAAN